jgi:hypothetical protein
MEPLVNVNENEEVLLNPSDSESIKINVIENEPIINDSKSIGEKLDDTLSWINVFLYNSTIYLGDVYMVINELFNPIRNFIKSIYVVKMKMP